MGCTSCTPLVTERGSKKTGCAGALQYFVNFLEFHCEFENSPQIRLRKPLAPFGQLHSFVPLIRSKRHITATVQWCNGSSACFGGESLDISVKVIQPRVKPCQAAALVWKLCCQGFRHFNFPWFSLIESDHKHMSIYAKSKFQWKLYQGIRSIQMVTRGCTDHVE